MTLDDKKEIIKAYFYKYEIDTIAEIFNTTSNAIEQIINENKDFLNELEERIYD